MSVSEHVAESIRAHRRLLGLTRDDLAAKVGGSMTGAMVSNIETGRRDAAGRRRRQVSVDELYDFARALGVDPDELLRPPQRCPTCRQPLPEPCPVHPRGDCPAIPEMCDNRACTCCTR